MTVFDAPDFDDHVEVHFFSDARAGLHAITAIHRYNGSVAGGGVRMWPYPTHDAALADVLRLSAVMTSKLALAGIPAGSAKSVIIGDPAHGKSPELLRAFGRAVASLGGRYFCAEDVGIHAADLAIIREVTPHVVGLPGEDPSPSTGLGVFVAIREAVRHRLGRTDLEGLGVAVQGVGDVGFALCEHLHRAGARLVIAEVDPQRLQRAVDAFGAEVVRPDRVIDADVEVLAPCALGEVIDAPSVDRLRAAIICGGANNILADPSLALRLHQRHVLFVPDHLSNSGGVMAVAAAREGWPAERLAARVQGLAQTCAQVFREAAAEGTPVADVVERLTRSRIAAGWSTSMPCP
jgi:leucine dehydrogenase